MRFVAVKLFATEALNHRLDIADVQRCVNGMPALRGYATSKGIRRMRAGNFLCRELSDTVIAQ